MAHASTTALVRKVMRARWCLLVALIFLVRLRLPGQDARQLSVTEVVSLPEQHSQRGGAAVRVPVKCSPTDELYVQFEGAGIEPGVSVISEDRRRINRFGLEQIPGLEGAVLKDFAPGPSHDLFLLASKNIAERGPTEYFVAHLKEGSPPTVAKLDLKPGFRLNQMAVLGSDGFIVAGFFGWQHLHAEPFTAIFDGSGQFVRSLALSGDLNTANESPNTTGKDPLSRSVTELARSEVKSTEWMELSSLQTADDGSVYLLRYSPEGPLFLISPGGAVQRVALRSPQQGSVLSSAKVADGKVAAEYYLPARDGEQRVHFLTVTDLSTGQLVDTVRYQGSDLAGVGLVCYRNQTFEFLAYGADGHLKVIRAASH